MSGDDGPGVGMSGLGGSLERAVMDIIWSAQVPMRVRELLGRLNEGATRPVVYNTVQTVAERLVGKGMLLRTPDKNAIRYSPARSRDEYVVAIMMAALTQSEDHTAALVRFAESVEPSDAQQILDVLRRRMGDGPVVEA